MLLNLGFKKEKFKIGVGGYVGYRVGGYTKEVYAGGGKEKDKGSLALNNFKYGLTTEVGMKYGGTLFFRYDLNDLFKDSQTNMKDMRAFSFGIRI